MRFRRNNDPEKQKNNDELKNVNQIIKSEILDVYKGVILSGVYIWERLTGGFLSDTKIFLCPYAGTGDVYLAALYINAFAKKNKIDDFVVAVIGTSNYKIISLFDFEKKEKLTQEEADNLVRLSMFLGEYNDKIILMHHDAPQEYSGILENMRNINGLDFRDLYLYNVFGYEVENTVEKPVFDYNDEKIGKIFKENKLVEGKTVVISPYVTTLPSLPNWVWKEVARELNEEGYTVCTNCGRDDEDAIEGTIPLYFDYKIAVPLLEKCGFFVGIRSGFCDVISSAKCRKIIIYQPYLFWGDGTNYDYFCMNKIGLCNDAIEFDYEGIAFLDLIDRVVKNIISKEPEITYDSSAEKKSIDYVIVIPTGKIVEELENIKALFKNNINKKFILSSKGLSAKLKNYLELYSCSSLAIVDSFEDALNLLPSGKPFVICDSDCIHYNGIDIDMVSDKNILGIDKENGETKYITVYDKKQLYKVAFDDDFLICKDRVMDQTGIKFETVDIEKRSDINVDQNIIKDTHYTITQKKGLKIYDALDKEGQNSIHYLSDWYKTAKAESNKKICTVITYDPLILETEDCCPLSAENNDDAKKKIIIGQISDAINELHNKKSVHIINSDFYKQECERLYKMLEKIKDVIPCADELYININNKKCKNVIILKEDIIALLNSYRENIFSFSHGNILISEMFLDKEKNIMLPDPKRALFFDGLFADSAYDWAKLYYSVVGKDISVRRHCYNFEVLSAEAVNVQIDATGWEKMEEYMMKALPEDISLTKIRLFHALIWFEYCCEENIDYETMCLAYYMGTFYLNELL